MMAQPVRSLETETRNRRSPARPTSRRPVARAAPDIIPSPRPSDTEEPPAQDIHPLALRWAVVAAAWFVLAMTISFSGAPDTDYLMGVVLAFSVIFFGLTLGFAIHVSRHDRWSGGAESSGSFRDFMAGEVGIGTGRISGRAALAQLLILPITLALGGTAIGLVFVLLQ